MKHLTVAFNAAALSFGTYAQSKFPTDEVPKSEPEYLAKVKTAAPASVVSKATITIAGGRLGQDLASRDEWLYLLHRR